MQEDCQSLPRCDQFALRIAFGACDSITDIDLHQIHVATDLGVNRRRAERLNFPGLKVFCVKVFRTGFDVATFGNAAAVDFAMWMTPRDI